MDRQKDKIKDSEKGRQTARQTGSDRNRRSNELAETETDRKGDIQTGRKIIRRMLNVFDYIKSQFDINTDKDIRRQTDE